MQSASRFSPFSIYQANNNNRSDHSLAQNRQETGVQTLDALLTGNACKTSDKPRREITFRNESYAGRLEGRKEDIGKEPILKKHT